MTNGGFSDSQFGDIADEENYTGLPAEASASSPKIKLNANEDTVILANYGRPTAANLSGKYTSCTNKNESLSFQANKRLVTIRAINNTSQTEYAPLQNNAYPMETAKQILSKKGSKCKCH